MTMHAIWTRHERRWEWALAAGMLLAFAYLLSRSLGLYPVIFADELFYDTFARLVPLSEATVPSYLYYVLYGATSACGPGFLDCARGLNALLLVAAAPFIYLTARQLCSKAMAFAIAMMSLLMPFNSFTTYFMPEAMYFLAFFVLTWVALVRTGMHWALHALVCGLIIGAMTLIKVHALFLVPPMCLFAMHAVRAGSAGRPWLARALASAAIVAGAALAVKFGLGYLMGGPNALHLFGTFYGAHVTNTGSKSLSTYLLPAWINGRGHVLAMALLFALPLAVGIHTLAARALRRAGAEPGPVVALTLYALLMLGAAFGMTIAYTATIDHFGPRELERLHMRYYDFAFPLLMMVAAGAARTDRKRALPLLAGALALALALGVGAALVVLPGYKLSMIDGPDIAALFANASLADHGAQVLAVLQLAALGLWLAGRKLGARLFLFALLPLMLIASDLQLRTMLQGVAAPNAFDLAGQYVREHVPKNERKDVVVAGAEMALMMRAKFQIDDAGVGFIHLAPGERFAPAQLPLRSKWLLMATPDVMPADLPAAARTGHFALVSMASLHRKLATADFTAPQGGAPVAALEGLDKAEPFGRWSNAGQVTIRFRQALPKRLNLLLKGLSYGPNADQDYVMRIGGAERRFRIGHAPAEVLLQFDTDGAQDTLVIDIPQPTAPHSVEQSTDTRTLGLGLVAIEIGERP